MPIKYSTVEREASALAGVESSSSYGTPALKVRGKLMVRLKEDGKTIVLRTTWEDRERLMVMYPEVFHVTDHYRNHPWVLMHLGATNLMLLRSALMAAWRLSAPKSLLRAASSEGGDQQA